MGSSGDSSLPRSLFSTTVLLWTCWCWVCTVPVRWLDLHRCPTTSSVSKTLPQSLLIRSDCTAATSTASTSSSGWLFWTCDDGQIMWDLKNGCYKVTFLSQPGSQLMMLGIWSSGTWLSIRIPTMKISLAITTRSVGHVMLAWGWWSMMSTCMYFLCYWILSVFIVF